MKYFTGIDVSLRSVSICVVDEAGVVQYEAKVPAEVDLIVASLRRVGLDITQVGLEAGTLTQYLTYGLQKAGPFLFTPAPCQWASVASDGLGASHAINDYPLCIEREPDPSTRRELRRAVSVATHHEPHNKHPLPVFKSTTDVAILGLATTGFSKCNCHSISARNLSRHRWRRVGQRKDKQERSDLDHGA